MITKDLLVELHKYGLTIIKNGNKYCLVEENSGECYEDMTIHYIQKLVLKWKKKSNQIVI